MRDTRRFRIIKPRLKLGVTGGIGSGKTSVCRVFSSLGIPVFSTDPEAKTIMDSNGGIIKRINSLVGRDLYIGGSLDRQQLATLIFNNPALLGKINSLVHPLVFDKFERWVKEQSAPYVIMEAAILFESGASKLVDKVATVVAPVEERVQRVILRNNLTREQVLERMRNQMTDEERIVLSDFLIHNSEDDMIIPAILKIHDEILTLINSET
jgi:dephospho-CoA kinase